jgi:uncharacterized membrane protein YfcA
MDFQLGFVVAGLLVGLGGGRRIFNDSHFIVVGIPPTTAVGTDLLYAAFTKMGGVFVHHRKIILIGLSGWLSLGSVPAALVTLWVLHSIKDITAINNIIKYSLGWALFFTSVAVLFKKKLLVFSQKHAGDKFHSESKTQNTLTVGIDVLLGATVTLTR